MNFALSIAWRLTLATALVANPLVGLGSAAAMALAKAAPTQEQPEAPCHELMEGQHPSPVAQDASLDKRDAGCTDRACDIGACVGTGALYVHGLATDWKFCLDVLPSGPGARAAIAPPQARMIRPPIA